MVTKYPVVLRLVINANGGGAHCEWKGELPFVPREGDRVSLASGEWPYVTGFLWFPENAELVVQLEEVRTDLVASNAAALLKQKGWAFYHVHGNWPADDRDSPQPQ